MPHYIPVLTYLATERERNLTTGKRAERTKLDFRCPICRSAIGQASCLICARRRQLTFPFCCYSATVRIPVHTAPKCSTEPVRYVTLPFRDRRGAASQRFRNRADIAVLICKQKPYIRDGFNAGERAIRYSVNMAQDS